METAKQLRDGGCPEEEIAKLVRQERQAADFEIWPENVDALRAFLFAESQWRVLVTFSKVIFMGIEHDAIERAFTLEPPADLKDAWHAVLVLEAEAARLRNADAH